MDGHKSKPLVVDLDRTFLESDLLVEYIFSAVFKDPIIVLELISFLFKGKFALKSSLAVRIAEYSKTVPENKRLRAYIEEQSQAGRKCYLVSASHHDVVEAVARRFDLFDGAQGTTADKNLKGIHKAEYLKQTFPDGFVYAGDSPHDLPVWVEASAAITVGAPASVRKRLDRRSVEVEAEFPAKAATFKVWRKALRLHQWAKNLLIFVAVILSHSYFELDAWVLGALGFLLFGAVASATYILNDIADIAADRLHRTKSARPFAANLIKPEVGVLVSFAILVVAFAISALVTGAAFWVLLCYLIITLAYTIYLKRVVLLDAATLAVLFTLRVAFGAVLIGEPISIWLLVFSLFFFLSLSLAKRHVEVVKAAKLGGSGPIPGRGYHVEDEAIVLSAGVSSAFVAVFIICLFIMESAYPSGVYAQPPLLWALPAAIFLWVCRIWLLAHRGELDDDPVAFAVRDRLSLVIFGAMGAAFILSVWGDL